MTCRKKSLTKSQVDRGLVTILSFGQTTCMQILQRPGTDFSDLIYVALLLTVVSKIFFFELLLLFF